MRNVIMIGCIFLMLMALVACSSSQQIRRAGQTEMYRIDAFSHYTGSKKDRPIPLTKVITDESILMQERKSTPIPTFGDFIRYPTDILAVQVLGARLQNIPMTLTGSHDLVLLAEVWENAAAGKPDDPNITNIVYYTKHQMIPGFLNFKGNLAYGPTSYKGHPLKLKFKLIVLQKEQAQNEANVVDVIAKYASLIPTYGVLSAPIGGLIRDFLLTAPDVISFDYEVTAIGDRPIELREITQAPKLVPSVRNNIKNGQISGADTAGSLIAVNANKNPMANIKKEIPYLQYGTYAFIETIPRQTQQDATTTTEEMTVLSPSRVDISKSKLGYRDGMLYLLKDNGEKDKLLEANYLIVSITPELLEERNDLLYQASEASKDLLTKIGRTTEELNAATRDIQTHADDLKTGLLKAKATTLAGKIARESSSRSDFEQKFNKEWHKILARNELTKDAQAEDIGKEAAGGWADRFRAPATGNQEAAESAKNSAKALYEVLSKDKVDAQKEAALLDKLKDVQCISKKLVVKDNSLKGEEPVKKAYEVRDFLIGYQTRVNFALKDTKNLENTALAASKAQAALVNDAATAVANDSKKENIDKLSEAVNGSVGIANNIDQIRELLDKLKEIGSPIDDNLNKSKDAINELVVKDSNCKK